MTTTTKCEFCDKRGLPLLLVRDAVATGDSGAPRAPNLPIELAPALAHYTKRILRSGYVNVFDEARRRWEAYFVTSDGYLFKLLQTPGVTPVIPKKPFNCPDQGHRAVASCITIPDPLNASKIWIGFSDVLWTDAVRNKNEDPAYRRRHMTEIDVNAALKGNLQPHQKVANLAGTVAEYSTTRAGARANFSWSPFKVNERQDLLDRTKRECEVLRPGKGLIVTLSDPAGIAQELAALIKLTAITFVEKRPDDKRNLAASAAIDQIRKGICDEAERREIAAAEKLVNEQIRANPIGHMMSESVQKSTERLRNINAAALNRVASSAWKKYDIKFNDQARELWLKNFDERFTAFDKENIAPLATAHVLWMKSEEMASYFECNFDPNNADSGVVYTQVVANCVADTSDKKACADLYESWLNGDISEKRNILLRAFVFNQELTIEAVKNASTVSIGLGQIPWDNIFAAHNSAVEKLTTAAQDVSAQLVAQLGGPLVRMLNKVMDGSAGFRGAIMSMGIVAAHPILIIDIVDSRKNFEKYLTKSLIEAHGRPLNEGRLGQLVKDEFRRRQIHGAQVDGDARRRWVITIDREAVGRMPNNLNAKQSEKWLLRSLKTVEEIEGLNLNRWRNVMNANVRHGSVAAILQAASLMKLLADEDKSLKHDKADAAWRRQAGVAAIAATVSEAFGHFLAARAGQGMKFGQGLASGAGSLFKRTGARAGILAGLVMAALDFNKAHTEYKEGADRVVVGAYLGSGLASIILTLAIVNAWAIPVIGVLLLLVIGISVLIEYVKDNPIQDWLERCPWGRLEHQRYSDFSTEQAQLQLALG